MTKKVVVNKKLKVKVGVNNKNEGSRGSGKKNVKERKPSLQFRSNLIAVKSTLEILKLEDRHKKELQRTPFWNLFNAFFSEDIPETDLRKSDKDILKILGRFDETSKAFKLGSKKVKLTKRDISLIYGINSTGKKSTKKYGNKNIESEFVKRRLSDLSRVTAANLKDKLIKLSKIEDKIAAEDVARILCLYVIVVVFFATRGETLSWGIVHCVEDLDGMSDINWVEEIHRKLMKSISKSHRDPSKVTGCTSVFPYWLCEHTSLVEPKKNRKIPRFAKWSVPDLGHALHDVSIADLKPTKVIETELKRTKEEMREIFGKGKGKKSKETEEARETETEKEKNEEEGGG